MATASPAARASFATDLSAVLAKASNATTTKTRAANSKIMGLWHQHCVQHHNRISLCNVRNPEDRLAQLLVFGLRYRRGGQTGKPVRADTVDKALLAVGQGITHLGQPDPRKLAGSDKLHPILASFLAALRDEDGPSTRAYPANITILAGMRDALDFDDPIYGGFNAHIADLAIIAFYWLLRPAEYCHSSTPEARSQAFLLGNVHLTIDDTVYPALQAPLNDENVLQRITHANLEFSDQKNAVKGERVGHRSNNHDWLCPAKALGRICRRLVRAGANARTPLHRYYNTAQHKWYDTKPDFITNALRHSAKLLETATGIDAALISARSLRPGGATALLCANVDKDAIQLLGRWKSDAMLRYLRIQAATHSQHYSQRMLDHGSYTFAPQAFLNQNLWLPNEAPEAVVAAAEVLEHIELDD